MKILAIDASASPVSAAILHDGVLDGEFFLNTKTTHSQTLMPIIEALLKTTETALSDIDVFAVNAGPGSFTGVRIGTATVKGLSLPDNKPCAAVSTLAAMAYGMPYQSGIICAVMDARCMQVYHALFRLKDGSVERLTEDKALSVEELSSELCAYSEETVYLAGDGAELCYSAMKEELDNVSLAPQNLRFQRASSTAFAAGKAINDGNCVGAERLMPKYLRLPQAQRELMAKQQLNNK